MPMPRRHANNEAYAHSWQVIDCDWIKEAEITSLSDLADPAAVIDSNIDSSEQEAVGEEDTEDRSEEEKAGTDVDCDDHRNCNANHNVRMVVHKRRPRRKWTRAAMKSHANSNHKNNATASESTYNLGSKKQKTRSK